MRKTIKFNAPDSPPGDDSYGRWSIIDGDKTASFTNSNNSAPEATPDTSFIEKNGSFPMIDEALDSLGLSLFFVYMYSDLRKLVKSGIVPIGIEEIGLESDEMLLSDIVAGTPHKHPAYGPDGEGLGGIRGVSLYVTLLRYIASDFHDKGTTALKESAFLRKSAARMTILPQNQLPDAFRHRSAVIKKSHRWSVFVDKENGPEEETSAEGNYEGFRLMEHMMKHSLLNCPGSAEDLVLARAAAEETGLLYLSAFFESLMEASKTDKHCQTLAHILTKPNGGSLALPDSDVVKFQSALELVVPKLFHPGSPAYMMGTRQKGNDRRIVWMNDHLENKELVYIIAVEHERKRVVVTFRGTSTLNDMAKNFDIGFSELPNPIDEPYDGKEAKVKINNGYGSYLFTARQDSKRTKYDEIVDRIDEYGRELGDGGYSLYITGHSLGGALANLFGFFASTDRRFAQRGNPIRVFTVAAAIGARISFAKAFQQQEKEGLVQSISFINDEDIVPLLHYLHQVDCAHTGVCIRLFADENKRPPRIEYVHDVEWWRSVASNIQTSFVFKLLPWPNIGKIGVYHSSELYLSRIRMAKMTWMKHNSALNNMNMSEFYSWAATSGEAPRNWSRLRLCGTMGLSMVWSLFLLLLFVVFLFLFGVFILVAFIPWVMFKWVLITIKGMLHKQQEIKETRVKRKSPESKSSKVTDGSVDKGECVVLYDDDGEFHSKEKIPESHPPEEDESIDEFSV
eukprot:CAMPEP_0194241378 /NCGR_PEP_ID=MMETSP0158-20130606/7257_1 /TAXON_ID=33649 /ORGANISM="Thalassionema nitzschioides, Strain L26-B" /LENGTH=737 /DNA_ID=CAMNT_0038976249 /DNA_START=181 /DNA_END=2394 /DNA_ORIENTATION=-